MIFFRIMCVYTYILSLLLKAFQSNSLILSSPLDKLYATLGLLEQLSTSPDHSHTLSKIIGGKKELNAIIRATEVLGRESKLTLRGISQSIVSFKILTSLTLPIGQQHQVTEIKLLSMV